MRGRSNSKFLGDLVKDGIAEISMVEQDGSLTPLENAEVSDSRLFGKGQQGRVYATVVSYEIDGVEEKRLCALKTLPPKMKHNHETITEDQESSVDRNTLKLMAIVEKEGEQFALIPFCGLFLDQVYKAFDTIDTTHPTLKNTVILHIMTDLLFALQTMHKKGFTHGDLKFENVAYHLGHFCLIDMDCSHEQNSPVKAISGSPFFMHPACFSDRNFCSRPENDIYALGILLKLLLNDQETKRWMETWNDHGKNMSQLELLLAIGKEQSGKWSQVLSDRSNMPEPKSISETLSQATSIQRKLEMLAENMTDIRLYDTNKKYQLGVETFIREFNTLLDLHANNRSKFSLDDQESELREFYDALVPEALTSLERRISTPSVIQPAISFFKSLSSSSLAKSRDSRDSISSESSLRLGRSDVE